MISSLTLLKNGSSPTAGNSDWTITKCHVVAIKICLPFEKYISKIYFWKEMWIVALKLGKLKLAFASYIQILNLQDI